MNLTLNEQLMRDTGDAHICIFIANLATWIRFNASKTDPEHRNFHENRYWSYNSHADFVKYFGFWSTRQIRTIIKNCLDAGLILTNTFNMKRYDNTTWYTLTDKALEYYPVLRDITLNTLVENDKTLVENDNAIPEELNSLSNINITISENSKKSKKETEDKLIEEIKTVYHEELPDLPKIKRIDKLYRAQLMQMIKNWPQYQSSGNEFTIESFRNYLKVIKTSFKWLLEPYLTDKGNPVKCTLRKLTRDNTLTKIVNGEFSAS